LQQKSNHQPLNSRPKISSFSVIVAFICLSVLGTFFVPRLSVKLNPSRRMPVVNVTFSMYGQSARVVESEVTSKLEGMLSRLKGVQEVRSYSRNESGHITVRLSEHTDPDVARFEVAAVVRQAWGSLPQGVSYPSVYMSGTSTEAASPFLYYTVNAPYTPITILRYVEDVMKPKLAEIKGIDAINVSGATRMCWKMEYDYERLKSYDLSVDDLHAAIRAYFGREFLGMAQFDSSSNEWVGLALIREGSNEAFDPAAVQVSNKDGMILFLNQLVKCRYQEEEAASFFRINGLNSIYLSFTAKDDANHLQLSREIKKFLRKTESNLPRGYELHLSYDEGEYLQAELSKIYFRSGVTVAILLCFVLLVYRNLRYSLLILLSLVANVAIAAIFYFLLGVEMQLFSLAGLTISLSLIIDNAIIVSDQLVRLGNRKAFPAVLAATLTTMGSLVIIFFMNETIRINLQDFAAVVIINLTVSLVVAVLLVPALVEKLKISKAVDKKKRPARRSLLSRMRRRRLLVYFNRAYGMLIRATCRRKKWIAVAFILLFGLPVFLLPDKIERKAVGMGGFSYKTPDTTFFAKLYNSTFGSTAYREVKPTVDKILGGTMRLFAQKVQNGSYRFGDRGETSLNIAATLPNGATRSQMDALIRKMESYIKQYPEVRQFETNIADGRRASIRILFVEEHQRGAFPHTLQSKLISKAIELGGGSWSVYGLGDGFNNELREQSGSSRIKLLGYNYDALTVLAEAMRDSLLLNRRIKEVDINSEFSWYKEDYSEFVFDLNKAALAMEHISPRDLFSAFMPMFQKKSYVGARNTKNGYEPVYLFSKNADAFDVWSMERYPWVVNDKTYKLSQLASVENRQAPKEIAKENQQYRLCLQYEYIGSYQQSEKTMSKSMEIFNNTAPLGYKAEQETWKYWWGAEGNKQYWLLLLIIAIVYATSCILFNSLRQPVTIIFIIPISFIGIFLTFYWFNLDFDQGGFAAFVLLAGLVVNANIYILNEYNNIRQVRRTITPLKAFLKAWNTKIRPVFLTIVSTILGFIPFIVGEYREAFWFPLAAATIGGLIASLIAIFVLLPLFMGVGKR
jgi:multidrug efflux pump subunit AcrB